MGSRSCILHIGICKTGTTSIQYALASQRERLAQQGVVVPRSYGATNNHRHLVLLGLHDDSADAEHEWSVLRARVPTQNHCNSLAEGRRWIETELRSELDKYPEESLVVFSSEQLSQRLVKESEVLQLRRALERLGFNTIKVMLYVREQVGLSISWDSMEVLSGRRISPLQGTETVLNHEHLLKRWENIWGRERIHVRTYSKAFLEGGDVIRDFATHGLPHSGDVEWLCDQDPKNERLSAQSIWLIRLMNRILLRHIPRDAAAAYRAAIVSACKSRWPRHKPMQADPDWVNKLAKQYELSNQWVDDNYGTHLGETFGST